MTMTIDYQAILKEIEDEIQPYFGIGNVASYIPALANVPARKFGFALKTIAGETFSVGDANERFSIQSISKVFTLTLAMKCLGDDLWKRVGKEPSGNPFNSLVQLESEQGIPRNPLINAGAHVVADCIISCCDNARSDIIEFVNNLVSKKDIQYDEVIAASEKATGFRNAALANFLKSFGIIRNSVDEVLDVYFHQCSIRMNCVELAEAFLFLANGGVMPKTKVRILTKRQVKRINALMMTCGLYDAVGEFAYSVGLPGKSGIGGGIVTVLPNKFTACVWSPELDKSGNSLVGVQALKRLTTKVGMSVF